MLAFQDDALAQRFAEEHKHFLEQNNPAVLADLNKQGDLPNYLSSVGSQASEMFGHLMADYQHSPDVANLPHLKKVQALQSRRHEAEEIVRNDILFQPLPDQN